MKFFKFDKAKFKPNKSSMKELIYLVYISFIIFIITEVVLAMGTTSFGYIQNSTIFIGVGILLGILFLILFVFKKDKRNYYIGGFVLFLIMTPLIKYIWDKFYVFLDIPSDKIWCLILDYLIILFPLNE